MSMYLLNDYFVFKPGKLCLPEVMCYIEHNYMQIFSLTIYCYISLARYSTFSNHMSIYCFKTRLQPELNLT